MPVPKKRTTSLSEATKVEPSDHQMPDEQEFRHRMRTLAVSAMRVVIEAVMGEELEQCLSATWGECTPERKGYRNGSPDFSLQFKATRKVSETVALGAEYYSELGTTSQISPASDQSHTLFAVADIEFQGWSLNFGVGRGLTSATDRYTVKGILGFAF